MKKTPSKGAECKRGVKMEEEAKREPEKQEQEPTLEEKAYLEDVNVIYHEVIAGFNAIQHKRPNVPHTSRMLKYHDTLRSLPNKKMVGTLYTGGTLYCSHEKYHEEFLKAYAKDATNTNVLMSWTESCPQSFGIRCFFEIDYRSLKRLPTEEEMKQHVRMAQALVAGSKGQDDSLVYVAKCTRKLKYANKDTNDPRPKLAMGLHLVFPRAIAATTEELRQLALTLDLRISAATPFFAGCVDAASVHNDCATLRPLFAYRVDQCRGCYPERKKMHAGSESKQSRFLQSMKEWCMSSEEDAAQQKKKKKDDVVLDNDIPYDSDEEVDLPPLSDKIQCQTAGCWAGRAVTSPSIYTPWFLIDSSNQEFQVEQTGTAEEWILDMSIIPPFGSNPTSYKPPTDAPDPHTPLLRPFTQRVYPSEIDSSGRIKTRNGKGVELSSQTHPDLFKIILQCIRKFRKEYTNIVPQLMNYDQNTNVLFVNVKGTGFCCLADRYHQGNRIYFMLKLKAPKQKCEIHVKCFDSSCRTKLEQFSKWKKAVKKKQSKKPPASTSIIPPLEPLHNLSEKDIAVLESLQQTIEPEQAKQLKTLLGIFTRTGNLMYNGALLPLMQQLEPTPVGKDGLVYDPTVAMFVQPHECGHYFGIKHQTSDTSSKNKVEVPDKSKTTKRTRPEESDEPTFAQRLELYKKLLSELV